MLLSCSYVESRKMYHVKWDDLVKKISMQVFKVLLRCSLLLIVKCKQREIS